MKLGGRIGTIAAVLSVLLVPPSGIAQATYPGDNGRLAYSRWREPEIALMTADPDGTDVRRLTFAKSFQDPSWSANGRRIVYVKGNSAFDARAIGIMRADGTSKRRVPFYDGELSKPSFSPSGGRIIVSRWHRDRGTVWTLRTDGTDRRRVARQLGGHVFGGVYSPNGNRIAFAHRPTDANYSSIYTIRTDGTGLRQLTSNTHRDGAPDWSPDGSRIVFSRATKDFSRSNIFRMRADGSRLTRLTSYGSPGGAFDPAWSPNGRRIAFMRMGERYTIRIMRADGSNNHKAIRGTDHNFAPAWQPR